MKTLSLLAALLTLASAAQAQRLTNQIEGPGYGCTDAQKTAVEAAAGEASKRVWRAKMGYAGIGPASDDLQSAELDQQKRHAQALEETLFGKNDTDIGFYLTGMYTLLTPAKRDIRCAKPSDKNCTMRSGYFKRGEKPIWVCPNFFKSGAEQQARTIVHESAHAAGISESSGSESYCVIFTCADTCGKEEGQGTRVADNWSQFVHCAAGQPADKEEAITAKKK